VWVDVEQFQQCLRACQHHDHPAAAHCDACLEALTAAVALYRGDFLAGFTLSDCPAFDEWQFFQAESLRRDLADALTKLVQLHRQRGAYEAAIHAARRWLLLDPLYEPVHRELMQLYAWAGQNAAAVRQYHECQRLLDEELGVEPESATTALMEAIRMRRFPDTTRAKEQVMEAAVRGKRIDVPLPRDAVTHAPAQSQSQSLGDASFVTCARRHNLPAQSTPFVGREQDLTMILDRLQDPACRLLTLVGPGGIGKTRLALQAAQLLVDRPPATSPFADGIYFVPLTAVSTPDGAVVAIAEALALSFSGTAALRQQLLASFGTQQMLLVLDNYEQLLAPDVHSESTALITDLLAVAPGLKVLLTTRVALNVREEWFHQVGGLAFPNAKMTPHAAAVDDRASYDAIRFFDQCARRVQSNFSLVDKEAHVVRFCRLIEGMPLAIELAAAWLKVLTVEQIVDELAHSLDILTTRYQNVAARHRSMRLVLEQSWALLDPDEQNVLKRLAILRGGFRQAAAAQVAGASLPLLARLTEKALIRMDPSGRYQMHELLRQFAEEKLSADEQMLQTAQAQHHRYYLDFLRTRRGGGRGRECAAGLAAGRCRPGSHGHRVRQQTHLAQSLGARPGPRRRSPLYLRGQSSPPARDPTGTNAV
jgi:predicted ATPase